MSEKTEKSKIYAVVIRTKKLDELRSFYRDIIDLGPPIVDSNYWVEFKLGADTNLVLELIDNEVENSGETKNTVDFALRINDINAEKERLAKLKLEPLGEDNDRFGKRVLKYLDPDNNLIHFVSESD